MQARIQTHLHARERHERQGRERELRAVRQTATFLNHSINNLLATIQAAAELVEVEDEDSALRTELISQNVQAITEIIARLKQIRRVITTDYAGTEHMLDLDSSLAGDGENGKSGAQQ
jgi:nitrogen-specific signal transduction histidine kinase